MLFIQIVPPPAPPPPPPGLSIDNGVYVLLAIAILYGIFVINTYSKRFL
ncbi:hypothetical protein SHK09_06220 [Polaribacter sp. PL03]|nr:hypothetical protein [Polaribacter sp. PL03]MDX6746379.1 hypothetical protein [Polaribacter sp. PL03]